MKHKVSELEGALLDAAVAKALDWKMDGVRISLWGEAPITDGGGGMPGSNVTPFKPSTDWRDGGPIIERERIALYRAHADSETWCACVGGFESKSGGIEGPGGGRTAWDWEEGPNPLIAAMRAYVAAKRGEEVELP